MLIKASNPIIHEVEEEEEETSNDSPSLSEAFAKAQSTLQISDTEESAEKVETEKSEDKTEETKETLETKNEADLESIDPKTLPPELKPVYDNLMKGFTKGRQKDSEARKQAEKERDELKRQLMESNKQSDGFSELSPDQLRMLTPNEQAQYYQALTDWKAQKAVEAAKIEDFRNQALNGYESKDDRLRRPTDDKPNDKYDRFMDSAIGAALDAELEQYIQLNGTELGFPYDEHLSELIAEYDGYVRGQNERFIQSQNQKLKESSTRASKMSPTTSKATATPNKPSLNEALQMALEKQRA